MRERHPCVYIMASGRHGTIYIGVTSDLMARVHQHREGLTGGFTKHYGVNRLLFYEMHETMDAAIAREKRLKAWKRDWKVALIERENPFWEDWTVPLGFPPLP
jgi:putative endonuclease